MLRIFILMLVFLMPNLTFAEEVTTPEPVSDAEKQNRVNGSTDFAAALFSQFVSERGNVLFSPESVTQALAMTYSGARGITADEISAMLRIRTSSERLPLIMGSILGDLSKRNAEKNYQFSISNALWVDKEYTLEPAFLDSAKNNYGATARNLDFSSNPQESAGIVNAWVDEETEHKIPQLISPNAIGTTTKMILTNAIYFKGDWQSAFEKRDTKKTEFYQNPGQNAAAWMMEQTCKICKYTENDRYQATSMPHKGGDIEMVLLLPRDKNGIREFEQSLNQQSLREILDGLQQQGEVVLFLPRFKIESDYSLTRKLKQLGMTAAFDPTKADFTGMTSNTDLFISDVIHKAFIEVDETGTEAAAATAVIMAPSGMAMTAPTKTFRADHPFIFLLRDMHTGAIYFMGRIEEPAQ